MEKISDEELKEMDIKSIVKLILDDFKIFDSYMKYVSDIINNKQFYRFIKALVDLMPDPTESEVREVPPNTEFHTIRRNSKGKELKSKGRKLVFFCEDIIHCISSTGGKRHVDKPVWTVSNTKPLKVLYIKDKREDFFEKIVQKDEVEYFRDDFLLSEAILYVYIVKHGLDGWKAYVEMDQPCDPDLLCNKEKKKYYEFAFLEDVLQNKFEFKHYENLADVLEKILQKHMYRLIKF